MQTPAPNATINAQITIADYWRTAQTLGFPTAMWRLPNNPKVYFLSSFNEVPERCQVDLEELPAGFAIAPYATSDTPSAYFLPADLLVTFDGKATFLRLPSETLTAWKNFQGNLTLPKESFVPMIAEAAVVVEGEKERYFATVEQAIAAIRKGKFQKVVLSRKKTFRIPAKADVVPLFEKLCAAYPSAFVSSVYLPHLDEIWVGATPEILVSQAADGLFTTMALAGTQSGTDADGQPISEADALWRQKEIEEQALVSRYIINCFKKVRVREYEEIGPRTLRAGNLLHLCTRYTVDTKSINFPQMTTVMLGLLHPTSAVCGMPKAAADDFIQTHENYDREFYSGYLGPINIQGETNLFVNLRSMKIKQQSATLFAGGGITADSDPEKEWLETELKCKTLERHFV